MILGASGQIAQWVVRLLVSDRNLGQALLLRDPGRPAGSEPTNAKAVIGNVLDGKLFRQAMVGQDLVYANLAGEDLDKQAHAVIAAMPAAGVQRLVSVLSLGIYGEVPGRFGQGSRSTIAEGL
ncbi:NAD(P)H-binding protein [Comamonas sp. 4034]|uniref:NAD(P)H-binding protein n=1 Tax=Comamonas sp. 4034 TaxID=3156455 RepID=UPI003D2489C4